MTWSWPVLKGLYGRHVGADLGETMGNIISLRATS